MHFLACLSKFLLQSIHIQIICWRFHTSGTSLWQSAIGEKLHCTEFLNIAKNLNLSNFPKDKQTTNFSLPSKSKGKLMLNQLLQLCMARTAWSDSVIRSETSLISSFRSFSVNVLPWWLRNADQWKPDYRVVTNEKPRNQERFSADQ